MQFFKLRSVLKYVIKYFTKTVEAMPEEFRNSKILNLMIFILNEVRDEEKYIYQSEGIYLP